MRAYAKAAVAILGAAAIAVAEQFPETGPYAAVIIATITAFGVYMVPNIPE